MNPGSNQMRATDQGLKRDFVRILILVVVFVVVTVGVLAYLTRTALDIPQRVFPLYGLAGEVKPELALYHLWLEEVAQGDPTPQLINITFHLEQANKIVSVMLEGGEYEHHVVVGLEDYALRGEAEKLQSDIQQLMILGKKRLASMAGSRTGVDYDNEFDEFFEIALQRTDRLNAGIVKHITQQMKKYEESIYLFAGGIIIISLIFLFVFSRSNRQRYLESQKLMQSEARTHILFNASVDALIVINELGLIESYNQAAERIFGYTETEVKGQPFKILNPEPIASENLGSLLNYVRTSETSISGVTRELTGKRKDGSTFSLEAAVNTVRVDEKTLFVVTARDITERLAEQAELNMYKNTLDQTRDYVFMFDADSLRFSYINRIASVDMDYSDDEIREMTPVDIKPEFNESRFRVMIAPLLVDTSSSRRFETVHRCKDGHDIPVEISLQYFRKENKAGYFVAVARDITEWHKAEQEARDREASISAIVDNAVEGIITINDKGLVETYNHAAESIFGYKVNEVVGNNIKMLIPEHIAARHDGYLANYINNGKAKNIGICREVMGKRKDGSTFPMDLSLAEVELGDRCIFTGIVRDISERKLVEDELLKAKEDAEKSNRAKSDFLSRMSHELRTPLNAIVGFAQILEMEKLDTMERESVEHILKAGRHLTALINEVLDIARIESGRQNLSPEPVYVHRVLEDTWSLMRPLAAERSIRLKNAISEDCNVWVLADLQRLKQALLNLLSNAIKYNHDGGTVHLTCAAICDGIIRIRVSDTGPGIAAENRERVFEAFERLDAEKSDVEGSGVGLALSKALIELMGGKLGLDSEPGVGSTFWIELPLIDDVSEQGHDAKENPEIAGTLEAGQIKPATLLYIEDNIANLRLVEVALSHRPHIKLIAAMQGKLGLDLALSHKPDLILLDLHLPGLMGDQVLARLKSHPETQHIPVVIISADATKRQIEKLLTAGAYAYLTKPFNIKKLLHTVDKILESEDESNADH